MANENSTDGVRLSLCQMLEEEYVAVHGRPLPDDYPRHGKEDERMAALYQLIHALPEKRAALCLSGGGIRSATFGLGVLQGLADHGLLNKFDYFSTVSGGGYVGSWLSAWIYRQGINKVITDLRCLPESAAAPQFVQNRPRLDPEPAPLRHLRAYSNYITPRLGLLSADTWTVIGTYLRNLLLNWLVLIPLLAAVLLIPRFGKPIVALNPDVLLHTDGWCRRGVLALGFVLTAISIAYISIYLPSVSTTRPAKLAAASWRGQSGFLLLCLLPVVGSSLALVTYWAWLHAAGETPPGWREFALFGAALHAAGWLPYIFRGFHLQNILELLAIALTGAFGGVLVRWLATSVPPFLAPQQAVEAYICFAAPSLLGLFLVAMAVFIGVASRWTDDEDREWWARAGAWVLIISVLWSVASALVLLGPGWLSELFSRFPKTVASLGGVSGAITILLGRSAQTAATPKQEAKVDWLAAAPNLAVQLAAPLFAVFLVVLIVLGTNMVLEGVAPWLPFVRTHPSIAGLRELTVVWLALLMIGCGMALVINVNKFSLHAMYRNRLIRAYLGASRETRNPNPFTGFDPDDNLPVAQLAGQKPLHVVNIALNLVSGDNLAWQQRKAESFTVTPLHAGSARLGYRRAAAYAKNEKGLGISLGTAVAISGAAASPNMGYHSSPAVMFLLALFNARLGWWLGNPGAAGDSTFDRDSPRFAIRPLLAETFGLTDDRNKYVYLSDGGHFENLGLYEMVLRRCRIIVVSDAGCDPTCSFEDLGNAVRKIRVDLGVPIELHKIPIYSRKSGEQGKCCAMGVIQYSCIDGPGTDGLLLYVKPSFYGDESADIFNYAQANPLFPHEPTTDQWFSESQFESYRALGFHAISAICGGEWRGTTLDDLLQQARRYLNQSLAVTVAAEGAKADGGAGERHSCSASGGQEPA